MLSYLMTYCRFLSILIVN